MANLAWGFFAQGLEEASEFAIAMPIAAMFLFYPIDTKSVIRRERRTDITIPRVNLSKAKKKTAKKTTRRSGKEKANDTISWVNPNDFDPNESAQQNARRMLDEKYGPGNWDKGADSEFNKIVKWFQRGILYYTK